MGDKISLEGVPKTAGWQLPGGHKSRQTTADGVILIGDAAGFVDPLKGHGIRTAMDSGIFAAEACHSAIPNSNLRATGCALRGYEKTWRKVLA